MALTGVLEHMTLRTAWFGSHADTIVAVRILVSLEPAIMTEPVFSESRSETTCS